MPYARGEKVYRQWVNTTVELDRRRWAAGDEKYRPGTPWMPQSGVELFRLAEVFDPQALEVLEHLLTPRADEPTWDDVLIRQAR